MSDTEDQPERHEDTGSVTDIPDFGSFEYFRHHVAQSRRRRRRYLIAAVTAGIAYFGLNIAANVFTDTGNPDASTAATVASLIMGGLVGIAIGGHAKLVEINTRDNTYLD